jgi:flagellar biosynthesis protein FlhF
MKIKSYFAPSVEEAVITARNELGSDAMLVQTRKAPPESQHLGKYEVVFGVAPEARGGLALPSAPVASAAADRLTAEVAEMRRQLEGLRVAMRNGLAAPRWLLPSSEMAELFSALVAAEIPGELVQDIVERLHAQCGDDCDGAALERALVTEMARRFTADPTLGRPQSSSRIAALVGPPGAGKTTTLVKLAVSQGLAARKPVQLISLDTYRVAGAEQLRSFAAILGVGFQVLETPAGLPQALEEHRNKALVLIDTPGYSLSDMDLAADLAQLLTALPDVETQLVLTASMKSADLTRVVEAFQVFRPSKLLFTKMDETESFGPIFCEAARTGKALSFFGTGQRIPEDLAPASQPLLLDLLLRSRLMAARQAA